MIRVVVGSPEQRSSQKPSSPQRGEFSAENSPTSGAVAPAYVSDKLVSVSIQDLNWETLSIEELATLASTMSLLGGTQIYRLTGALAGERGEEFLDLAKDLVASPHAFIFEEEKLLKRPTDILKKAGAELEIHEAKKKEEKFNMFGLAMVFGTRDRKKLWLALQSAARGGQAPEAVAGMLHWKVRDMLSKGSQKYSKPELQAISRELVSMYHDSHRGAGDLELLLERFALRL